MRQGRLIATGAMLVFCLFAIWQSLLLSLTDRLGPGPGFFPFWLAVIGAVLAIALLITTFREAADPADAGTGILPHGEGGKRWLAIVALLAAVTVAMEFVGFRLAMLVFNAVLVIALGERCWPRRTSASPSPWSTKVAPAARSASPKSPAPGPTATRWASSTCPA